MSARSERPPKRPRDPRLDVFRGLGMFIILIAHIPRNPWADWIPARFGFSDATETFVFCSGVASSLAFMRVFEERGWLLGTARILKRLWQVYWAHIGVFVAIVAVLALVDQHSAIPYVRKELNLGFFLDDPANKLLGLLTLTYVPNYFDILPMYLVVLGLIPIVVLIARHSRGLLALVSTALWLAAAFHWLELSAEPWSDRAWFFNPFSWQLLFFLGFAFGRGWLPIPSPDRRLIALAVIVVIAAAPFSCHYGYSCFAGWGHVPWLGRAHLALFPLIDKTHLGLFRIVHFLATAYLAHMLAGENGYRLTGPVAQRFAQVGRQTLPVFLSGMLLAQLLGVTLDVIGRDAVRGSIVNLAGCGLLALVARVVEWFKSDPWATARPRALPAAEMPAAERPVDRSALSAGGLR